MKKHLAVLMVLLVLLCGCSGNGKSAPKRPEVTSEERQFTAPADGDLIAIFTTNLGEVRAVLYPDLAPMAVDNFVGLVNQGYYNGTTIWRSQDGFAVQGGDATGTGTGGSTIWSNNPYPLEANASLKHYAGALCAANSPDADPSTTSQFYFVQALPSSVDKAARETLEGAGVRQEVIDAYAAVGGLPYLDNTDTVFGQVYEGMDVVDRIADAPTDYNDRPRTEQRMKKVTAETFGTDYPEPKKF